MAQLCKINTRSEKFSSQISISKDNKIVYNQFLIPVKGGTEPSINFKSNTSNWFFYPPHNCQICYTSAKDVSYMEHISKTGEKFKENKNKKEI